MSLSLRRPVFDAVGKTDGAVDGITELWYNSERDLLDAYAMSTASAWPPTRSPT